jgi:hypothetical protein
MPKLIPMPSPKGTNRENLGIPAYDSRFGLIGRDIESNNPRNVDQDPEGTNDFGTDGNEDNDPYAELLVFLEENLSAEAYDQSQQLVSSLVNWMRPDDSAANDKGRPRPGAMDSNSLLRSVHATIAAQAHVEPIVGSVNASSAAGVYRVALKRLGNDSAANISNVPALKKIFDLSRRNPPARHRPGSVEAVSFDARFGTDGSRLKRTY